MWYKIPVHGIHPMDINRRYVPLKRPCLKNDMALQNKLWVDC